MRKRTAELNRGDEPTDSAAPAASVASVARVLCPVRGGRGSSATVDIAIARAREAGAALTFLYTIDLAFLGLATVARVKLMAEELAETGRFTLSVLCDKARAAGVREVDALIRQGPLAAVLREVVAERGASLVVVGAPDRTPGGATPTRADFRALLDELDADPAVQVLTVNPNDA